MAKKSPGAGRAGSPLPAAGSQSDDGARGATRPTKLKSSALVDTRLIYCGDNLDQLKKLPDACDSAFRTPHSSIGVAGSFYYHCDWHASHYVKVLLDQILGENNFAN